jgi:hypothetical protein
MAMNLNVVASDNFTMYSALRLISSERSYNRYDEQEGRRSGEIRDVRILFDLMSLSKLTELCVFHDKIFVDNRTKIWSSALLDDIVIDIDVPDRSFLIKDAIIKAGSAIRCPNILEYPLTVSEYATMTIEPDVPPHHRIVEGIPYERLITAITEAYGGARDFDIELAGELRHAVDHHFLKTLSFLMGAYYYMAISRRFGLGYAPHPARGHVVAAELATETGQYDARIIADSLVGLIVSSQENKMQRATEYFGHNVFHISSFPIIQTILSKCRGKDGFLPELIRFRNSRYGKGIRRWLNELLLQMDRGDDAGAIKSINCVIDYVHGKAHNCSPDILNLQIAIGPLSVSPLSAHP